MSAHPGAAAAAPHSQNQGQQLHAVPTWVILEKLFVIEAMRTLSSSTFITNLERRAGQGKGG